MISGSRFMPSSPAVVRTFETIADFLEPFHRRLGFAPLQRRSRATMICVKAESAANDSKLEGMGWQGEDMRGKAAMGERQ